jgi:hypothetical protein
MGLILVPLLLSAVFGLSAPVLARRLPPHLATWLLSVGAVIAAAASSTSIALYAFVLVAQNPVLVARGHWSDEFLRGHTRYATPIGALACLLVLLLAASFLRAAARRTAAFRDAHRFAAGFPSGELAVIDSPERHAFAVPGRPGRILATSGILRALDAAERRALLAHERAHLVHRHHLHQTAVHLAVAVNPLLRQLSAAVALSCERWADEDAAQTSRRGTVAAALTHAAVPHLATRRSAVLAAAGADVLARLAALAAPPPRARSGRLAALTGLLLVIAAAVAIALHDIEHLFELAQAAYRTGRR